MLPCRLIDLLNCMALPQDEQSRKALSLGLAMHFLSPGAGQVALHFNRILNAIDSGQVEFYFDAAARPVGFVTWAAVTPDVSRNMVQLGASALPADGWDNGTELWINDFFAYDGSLLDILVDLRDRALSKHATALYGRNRRARRIVKQVSRLDKTTFFAADPKGIWKSSLRDDKVNITTSEMILQGGEKNLLRALEIGRCILALRKYARYQEASLWASSHSLSEVVAIRQCRTYLASDNTPAGLLTWAWLSQRTISRIAHTPLHDIHISEWNEGDMLCLCDVVISDAVREEMEADIFQNLFPGESTILLYMGPAYGRQQQLLKVERTERALFDRWWQRTPDEAADSAARA